MLPTLRIVLKPLFAAVFSSQLSMECKKKNGVICSMFIQGVRDCLAENLRLQKNLMT